MASRVDFYVLPDDAPASRLTTACRLTEKAWRQGHRVYLLAPDAVTAGRLDELLWTFREESFVPHGLAGHGEDDPDPVLIGLDADAPGPIDVLINLRDDVPLCVDRCERVAELVPPTGEGRTAGRGRFQHYRDRGLEPDTHRVQEAGPRRGG